MGMGLGESCFMLQCATEVHFTTFNIDVKNFQEHSDNTRTKCGKVVVKALPPSSNYGLITQKASVQAKKEVRVVLERALLDGFLFWAPPLQVSGYNKIEKKLVKFSVKCMHKEKCTRRAGETSGSTTGVGSCFQQCKSQDASDV